MSDLDFFSTIVLGIVEGITEFIPVSSTGHLILTNHALGVGGAKVETFDIFIQSGAILAVVVLYWRRFIALLDFSKTQGAASPAFRGWDGLFKLFVACIPAFILGGLCGSKIKAWLFFPAPVAVALVLGGLAMILLDRPGRDIRIRQLEEVNWRQCLTVGLFQCAALWPGMSRSASTIIGGLVCGFERRVAAEFSFLVAVPVMLAATGYDLLKSAAGLSIDDLKFFGLGFFVAFIFALLAVKFFVVLLGRCSLRPFAVYRIVLGILVLIIWR